LGLRAEQHPWSRRVDSVAVAVERTDLAKVAVRKTSEH
jgi:hypothetical protein